MPKRDRKSVLYRAVANLMWGAIGVAVDDDLHARIEALIAEEHSLRQAHGSAGFTERDRERMAAIEVELDRTWDLLRQREALRDAGFDPGLAHERSADVVEGYEQ